MSRESWPPGSDTAPITRAANPERPYFALRPQAGSALDVLLTVDHNAASRTIIRCLNLTQLAP